MPFADPEKNREARRRWQAANPDKVREYARLSSARRRKANPAMAKAHAKKYRDTHKAELAAKKRANYAARGYVWHNHRRHALLRSLETWKYNAARAADKLEIICRQLGELEAK